MVLNFYLIILFLFTSFSNQHVCEHDQITKNYEPQIAFLQENHQGNRIIQRIQRQPIRIHVDFSNFKSGLTVQQQNKYLLELVYIEKDLFPMAIHYLEQRIRVYPVERLFIPHDQNQCHKAQFNNEHKTNGVEADLIIYVTLEENEKKAYNAWSSPCLHNPYDNNRPIAGQLNINIKKISMDIEQFIPWIDTLIHEITHILGFSKSLFGKWVDENGKIRGKDKVIKNIFQRGHERKIITTPELVKVAKEHFQCDSIEGIELEDNGGKGNIGSHWERMILHNEALTATRFKNSAYSKFTLAVLKDTGWYDVDYSKATPFYYGKNQGCEFLTHACLSSKKFHEFCYENEENFLCDLGYESRGYCAQDKYTETEQCKYKKSYKNGDCRNPNSKKENSDLFFESFSQKSKCIQNTITDNKVAIEQINAGCYEAICKKDMIIITVYGQNFVCKYSGQIVKIDPNNPYLNGYIKCPEHKYFCANFYPNCLNSCSGRGYCHDKKCECKPGFTGEDCKIFSGCYNNCNGQGECLPNGKCRCNQGWSGSDCSIYYKDILMVKNDSIKNQQKLDKINNHKEKIIESQYYLIDDQFQKTQRQPQKLKQPQQVLNHQNPQESQKLYQPQNQQQTQQFYILTDVQGVIQQQFVIQPQKYFAHLIQYEQDDQSCPDHCSNHGNCEKGQCLCLDGWKGDNCSQKRCLDDCNNNGKCIEGQCICDKGWSGENCSTNLEKNIDGKHNEAYGCENNCSGNGKCIDKQCQCNEQWIGQDCSEKLIYQNCPKMCSNNGVCIAQSGTCQCNEGFSGEACNRKEPLVKFFKRKIHKK